MSELFVHDGQSNGRLEHTLSKARVRGARKSKQAGRIPELSQSLSIHNKEERDVLQADQPDQSGREAVDATNLRG